MEESMESSASSSLDFRIRSAKRVVREATASALKFANVHQTDSSSSFIQNDTSMDLDLSAGTEIHTMKKMTEDEEFDLAMTLFGDDIQAIEREINDKLSLVEQDIQNYFAMKENQPIVDSQTSKSLLDDRDIEYDSFDNATSVSKQQLLEIEAKELAAKISFLQKCSKARVALDILDEYLLKACTGSKEAVLIPSTLSLQDAIDLAREARADLKKQTSSMNSKDAKVGNDILSAIEQHIEIKKNELTSKALAILDACITVTPSSVSIFKGPDNHIEISAADVSIMSKSHDDSRTDSPTNLDSSSITTSHSYESSLQKRNQKFEGVQTALEVLTILKEPDGSQKRLEGAITVIANELVDTVLRPTINTVLDALREKRSIPSKYDFQDSSVKSSRGVKLGTAGMKLKGNITTLDWYSEATECDDTTSVIPWWKSLLDFLEKVCQFYSDNVLNTAPCGIDIHPMFGNIVFRHAILKSNKYSIPMDTDLLEFGRKNPIIKLLGKIIWEHCIPQNCGKDTLLELNKISSIICESIQSFDSYLMNSNLLSDHTSLFEYSTKFEQKYNEKVRANILFRGRKLLIDGDYHNSIKVGINAYEQREASKPKYLQSLGLEQTDMSIFQFEECHISQVASDLMNLCTETMEKAVSESTSSHKLLPPILYRSTRELLDLYRATIPAVHGGDISNIPRTAAVFHNDCAYFAHRLLTLGLEFRDRFPPDSEDNESPMRKLCTFLDLVPMFRELAEQCMNDMVRHQKEQISQIISPRLQYLRDALGSSEGVVEWSDAETALTAGLYHLRHLSQAWKSILPSEVFFITMGSLVDHLFSLFLDKVLGTTDISVQASQFVCGLFQSALRGISELFGQDNTKPDSLSKKICKYSILYNKFVAVGKFMNMMNLSDINSSLSEGVFRSVTGAELSRLVTAVFSDSERRAKLLRLLETNSA